MRNKIFWAHADGQQKLFDSLQNLFIIIIIIIIIITIIIIIIIIKSAPDR